jgi:hypothetical protein
MADYQIVTNAGKLIEFSTNLDVDTAYKIAAELPRTSFLDWVLSGNTEKQALWTLKVAQDALDAETPQSVGQFLELVTKINAMQAKAKARVILRFAGVTLKAVTTGGNIGSVYVFTPQGYAGKITKEGVLKANGNLAPLLEAVAQNPEKAARDYGRETGACSCCGRELSDPVSVFGGIGPICLGRLAGEGARAELEADFKEHQAEKLLDAVLAS